MSIPIPPVPLCIFCDEPAEPGSAFCVRCDEGPSPEPEQESQGDPMRCGYCGHQAPCRLDCQDVFVCLVCDPPEPVEID